MLRWPMLFGFPSAAFSALKDWRSFLHVAVLAGARSISEHRNGWAYLCIALCWVGSGIRKLGFFHSIIANNFNALRIGTKNVES